MPQDSVNSISSEALMSIVGLSPYFMSNSELSEFAYAEIHRIASGMSEIINVSSRKSKPKRSTVRTRTTLKAEVAKAKVDTHNNSINNLLANPEFLKALEERGQSIEDFKKEMGIL